MIRLSSGRVRHALRRPGIVGRNRITWAIADLPASSPSLYGLDGVNFFLAAALAGFGPYVAAYLGDQKWTQIDIGLVLTAGGVAGLLTQLPGGELLQGSLQTGGDRSWRQHCDPQCLYPCILAAPTVGFHRTSATGHDWRLSWTGDRCDQPWHGWSRGVAKRLGRNQRFASTGALVGAALMGLVGYLLSYQAIFLIVALLGLPLFVALARIPAVDIHFGRSCGAPGHHGVEQPPRASRRIYLKDF